MEKKSAFQLFCEASEQDVKSLTNQLENQYRRLLVDLRGICGLNCVESCALLATSRSTLRKYESNRSSIERRTFSRIVSIYVLYIIHNEIQVPEEYLLVHQIMGFMKGLK